jgi:hypothetical protein
MDLSIHIHSSWLDRPVELRNQLAALAMLEVPFPGSDRGPGDDDEFHEPAARPGRRAPPSARDGQEAGDDEEDSPPADGRQLLGWASKQVPDLKGVLIGYGKKKGLHSKIVEWTPQQVAAAYRFARGQLPRK